MRLIELILIIFSTPAYAAETVATWYGQAHAGKRTESGETFNPDGLTAAHRSLPFGTCLHISNPKSGRSVSVRVNDRGSFTKGVSRDLSSWCRSSSDWHAFDAECECGQMLIANSFLGWKNNSPRHVAQERGTDAAPPRDARHWQQSDWLVASMVRTADGDVGR